MVALGVHSLWTFHHLTALESTSLSRIYEKRSSRWMSMVLSLVKDSFCNSRFFDEMPNSLWCGCFCHELLIQPFRISKNALLCTAAQIKTLYCCVFQSTDCTGVKHVLQNRVLCVCACWQVWSAVDIACYGNHRWNPVWGIQNSLPIQKAIFCIQRLQTLTHLCEL